MRMRRFFGVTLLGCLSLAAIARAEDTPEERLEKEAKDHRALLTRDKNGKLSDWLYAKQQSAQSMLKILGYK